MSVLLQLRNLSFSRPHKVLFRDLHLSIHSGDRIGLVGHNGSGKSSLLHVMAQREQPEGVKSVRCGICVWRWSNNSFRPRFTP